MLAFDFETTDPRWRETFQPVRVRMIGVSVSLDGTDAVYYFGESIPPALAAVLQDPAIPVVAHNAVFEYIVARNHGVTIRNLHCTKAMSYVLRRSTTYLKGLTWSELGLDQTHFDEVDWDNPEEVVNYGGADSALTSVLAAKFTAALHAEGMWELYEQERRNIPVLGEMTMRGINLDVAPIKELADDLNAEGPGLVALILSFFNASALPDPNGTDAINLNAGAQLAALLYGPARPRCTVVRTLSGRNMHDPDCPRRGCVDMECAGGVRTGAQTVLRWWPPGLGWKVRVRTEGGDPATDMDTLRLYDGEPIVGDLVKYKSIQRLLNNELHRWPLLVQEDGRIHPSFHAVGHWEERGPGKESPSTRRYSSSGPNFQNITHHGDAERPYVVEWAKRLRRAIIPTAGMLLWEGDIGQEEPRIGAMLAEDADLLNELTHGDVYKPIAALAFQRPVEEIGGEERQIGKRNWMAWLNGAGPDGIIQAAFWLKKHEAARIIAYLAERHPLIEQHRTRLVAHLRKTGYTETYFGWRVYRSEVWSGSGPARAHAERSVMPDAIQGTAADVMKVWMPRIHAALPQGAHLLITEHDKLAGECVPELLGEVCHVLAAGLAGILPIALPFEFKHGSNWSDLSEAEVVWTT